MRMRGILLISIALLWAPVAEAHTVREGGVSPPVAACDGHDHTHSFENYKKWAKKFRGASSLPKRARERHRHQVMCAAGPGHQKAMIALWKKIRRSILPPNHDLWIRIGRCEQPGSGYRGVYWSHPGPTYQGGLGFWYGTWDAFRYPGMPENAGDATWRQQMKVANRLLRMYGTSPWGCA